MARREIKLKRRNREDYPIKEQMKIEEGVFERRSIENLRKLTNRGILDNLAFLISTGKEADVYVAWAGDALDKPFVAVKIFRVENTGFVKRLDYINGDPRFGKIKNDMYNITNTWCKKEFANLNMALEAGVKVPKAYSFAGNVLAMEFVGDENGSPAKIMKNVKLEDPKKVEEKIVSYMKKLAKIGMVHADLSEYNVLINDGEPWLIDMGQAVVKGHPQFNAFVERDAVNITYYFNKQYGINKDYEKLTESLLKEI